VFIELAEAGGHLTLAWEENSFHFMAFNCLFLWKKCVGFSTISHRELDVLTLWNDAVILKLLLQQSIFLLQCFHLT